MTLRNSFKIATLSVSGAFQWANWTITYLDKNILILHHQRIGVNVAGEWFALVGICAVLQLAGDIQRLCSHKHTHTHTHTQRHTHTHTSGHGFSDGISQWREAAFNQATQPPLASYITRVSKVVPVREELCGEEDRWPARRIAFFTFYLSAGREPVPTC